MIFSAVIVNVLNGSSYCQPFNSCCELERIRNSLGSDYVIVDIFYNFERL